MRAGFIIHTRDGRNIGANHISAAFHPEGWPLIAFNSSGQLHTLVPIEVDRITMEFGLPYCLECDAPLPEQPLSEQDERLVEMLVKHSASGEPGCRNLAMRVEPDESNARTKDIVFVDATASLVGEDRERLIQICTAAYPALQVYQGSTHFRLLLEGESHGPSICIYHGRNKAG